MWCLCVLSPETEKNLFRPPFPITVSDVMIPCPPTSAHTAAHDSGPPEGDNPVSPPSPFCSPGKAVWGRDFWIRHSHRKHFPFCWADHSDQSALPGVAPAGCLSPVVSSLTAWPSSQGPSPSASTLTPQAGPFQRAMLASSLPLRLNLDIRAGLAESLNNRELRNEIQILLVLDCSGLPQQSAPPRNL